jgi:hypothetical protein
MDSAPKLVVSTETWGRDSYGLFDYESESVYRRMMVTAQDCYLVRKDNEVALVDSTDQEVTVLARLEAAGHGYIVKACTDSLWRIVRSSDEESLGVQIDPGTVIKLGRVQILVSELVKEASQSTSTLNSSEDEQEEGPKACKICFGESEEDNCLISPCDCSGSVRYVHLACLQRWLTSKCTQSSGEDYRSYYWSSMHCELCQKIYPFSLSSGGRSISLFNVGKADELTLALELLARSHHTQSVHIVTTKQHASLKLGRGHESDLRISDISVSRCHAVLNIREGKLFIRDNQSKFGTLIQLPGQVLLGRGDKLVVQTGRTVTTFQLPA